MAQQVGALRIKGKVGNVVGFGNSASDKSNKNFVRQAAANVANPKTYRQATQRSKVKPAAAFYSAFENVLNHAFLPSQRASKNRNRFMKLAMLLGAVPDVRKDDSYLPVLPYQVSEGSLGLDYLTTPVNQEETNALGFNIILGSAGTSISTSSTVADLSSAIKENNVSLEEGEEITVMAVLGNASDLYVRRAVHFSFVLNTQDKITILNDILGNSGLTIASDEIFKIQAVTGTLLCAAVIISSKTSASWRYTKSYMWLTKTGRALPNIEDDVIASYMSAASINDSDKILQQANNSSVSVVKVVSTTTTALSNASGITGTLSPTTATVAVYNSGKRAVVTMLEEGVPVLAYKNGDNWAAIKRTGTGEPAVEASVTIDTTNLAGNPTVDVSFVVAAGL